MGPDRGIAGEGGEGELGILGIRNPVSCLKIEGKVPNEVGWKDG